MNARRASAAVSVVIPTCDRLDLLRRAVDSVSLRTFVDYGVIIVDDGVRYGVPTGYFTDHRVSVTRTTGARDQLGYGADSVRRWVAQAEIDAGDAAGMSTADLLNMKTLEQENKELRRANEVLE